MTAKDKILNSLRAGLERHNEILFAYVFGSFLESDIYNDVDLAVFLADGKAVSKDRWPARPALSGWYDIRLASELEKAAGVAVDLVILNTAPDHLIHAISKGNVLIDHDEDLRIDFITAAWKRYWDFKPKRREYLREVAEG